MQEELNEIRKGTDCNQNTAEDEPFLPPSNQEAHYSDKNSQVKKNV